MAILIPELNFCLSRMTNGEKRFARRLREKLEDDYLCWYDVPVGKKTLYPDFIILHPRRGILILEVKDWKPGTIKHVTHANVTLLTPSGPVKKSNPFEQARHYAHTVVDLLKNDPLLTEQQGEYAGNLVFPWGYGVVLANITRKMFERMELGKVFEPDRIICTDEMTESADAEGFQERLWGMFSYSFGDALTMPQVDRIRWHLFPEVRIDVQMPLFPETVTEQTSETPEPELHENADIPDIIRVMDLQQEQLARTLGSGHRVIHGVSGSGKTLILCYRCVHLAEQYDKPILVLCFNVALATKLSQMIAQKGLQHRIVIRNFHGWCSDQLQLYHVPRPEPGPDFFDQMVLRTAEAVDRGQIPRVQYGAVLIDEGHDFRQEWLRLAVQMVDPETDALLLLYDSAQRIYGNGKRLGFSLSSVGIKARGRTTILRINYRNTEEILSIAYEFAKDIFDEDDGDIPVVRPESAGRKGMIPDLMRFPSLQREAGHLAYRFNEMHRNGTPWGDMAVVYRQGFIGKEVTKTLRRARIPVEWLHESSKHRYFHPDQNSVKVVTMHSSKGLEFPTVAIPGLGYMPHTHGEYEDEAKLLYVAMTRATDHLVLTSHKDSEFTQKISEARERAMEAIC